MQQRASEGFGQGFMSRQGSASAGFGANQALSSQTGPNEMAASSSGGFLQGALSSKSK